MITLAEDHEHTGVELIEVSCLYCDESHEHEVENVETFLDQYVCPNGCPQAFYITNGDEEKYCPTCKSFRNRIWHVCFLKNHQEWVNAGSPKFWIPRGWSKRKGRDIK